MFPIAAKATFIKTRNVRNFGVMMDGLALAEGEGRLGMVRGEAGLGKSRTCTKWYGEHLDTVYLRAAKAWETSYTEFLQALCRELGIKPAPYRKGRAFAAVVDNLIQTPKTLFIDELEKLPSGFLEIVRDIADMAMTAVVLIGEEELAGYMSQNRRVWSRTFQVVEFKPVGVGDVMLYIKESTDGKIMLSEECASAMHRILGGNFRGARRTLLNLVQICNAKKSAEVSIEMVEIAYKTGLLG